MLVDLDLLLTAVFCTADDLLPEEQKNARRSLTDAEVATLCVAQAVMDISSDREFLAVARSRLGTLFPKLPCQPGFHKRRRRLTETIEWLIGVFAADSPGHSDPVVLLDSTPVECGRSVETVRHLCCAPDGTASGGDPGSGRPARARGRSAPVAKRSAWRRADRLRQGLCRPGVRR